jgi:hypothetical protein
MKLFRRGKARAAVHRPRRTTVRLDLEAFEDRILLNHTVININATGPGSLAQAITDANNDPNPSIIDFNIPDNGSGNATRYYVIALTASLPTITNQVTVDGSTESGFIHHPAVVQVSVSSNSLHFDGLTLGTTTDAAHGSAGSTIKALNIVGFTSAAGVAGAGIRILTDNNKIVGDVIGPDQTPSGTAPGNTVGVFVDTGTQGNTVGGTGSGAGNTIAGNTNAGVSIGGTSTQNSVTGNVIGLFSGSADSNSIGVLVASASNVVSANTIAGNASAGIDLTGTGATQNVIQGNLIGTNGSAARANGIGVLIDTGATSNTVGGGASGAGNTIAGNTSAGVSITGTASTANAVLGNLVGGSVGGSVLGNGIGVALAAPSNIVGGAAANTIGGNFAGGVVLSANSNTVSGNYIGTDSSGNSLKNTIGVSVSSGSNLIAANTIAGNATAGVSISGASATQNSLVGNLIGVVNGTALSNAIGVAVASTSNSIGTAAGAANTIAGNATSGLSIAGTGNTIQGNLIGGKVGTSVIGNGIGVVVSGTGNSIGDTAANTIGGNSGGGVVLTAGSNTVSGNYIGTDTAGNSLANTIGVAISSGSGSNSILGNTIAGNASSGLSIAGTGNTIRGNLVGGKIGTSVLGNGIGIGLSGAGNSIGGAVANTIGGNSGGGVVLTADSNTVSGNYIGTDASGSSLANTVGVGISSKSNVISANTIAGNASAGVSIGGPSATQNSLTANLIGVVNGAALSNSIGVAVTSSGNNIGAASGANTIAGNSAAGVSISGTGNSIQGNLIGGLIGNGIGIALAATGNSVGTSAANTIGGNSAGGVVLSANSNTVSGNLIGTNIAGTSLRNTVGVSVTSGSNTISANTITGNATAGVSISGSSATSNVLTGNLIGTDTADNNLGNAVGVAISDPAKKNLSSTIGGTGASAANTIGFNVAGGVTVNGAFGNAVRENFYLATNGPAVPGSDIVLSNSGNKGQSPPTLISATGSGTTLSVQLTVATQSDVDFYLLDTTSSPQRRTFLGTASFAAGTSSQTLTVLHSVGAGNTIVATATDPTNGTSSFSQGQTLAGPFTVTNLQDSGAGSLRAVLTAANGDTTDPVVNVVFQIPASLGKNGNFVINVTSAALPTLTRRVVIDGSTESSFLGSSAIVQLNGAQLSGGGNGLTLGTNSGSSTIEFLNLVGFASASGVAGAAIRVLSSGDVIASNAIGYDQTGGSATGNRVGILLDTGAQGTTVGGTAAGSANTIAGNAAAGISISGSGATGNLLVGNQIGRRQGGTTTGNGVGIVVATASNTIGGTDAGSANTIGGNATAGIKVTTASATQNAIEGNFIGTDGSIAWANGTGVLIDTGAASNTVGGTSPTAANTIAGNTGAGVSLSSDGNVIQGNLIGSNASGASGLGNSIGVQVSSASNTIQANTIAGNTAAGVSITGSGANGNTITSNLVGARLGNSNLGNAIGIAVSASGSTTPSNTIGGAAGAANTIGFNATAGIVLASADNLVQGNNIGSDNLAGHYGNGDGIRVSGAGNTITGNVIGRNSGTGVSISGGGASANLLTGNFIGTDAAGDNLGNSIGVSITGPSGSSLNNTVGGTAQGDANTIGFNAHGGVTVSTAAGNVIRENLYLGTNGTDVPGSDIVLTNGANKGQQPPALISVTGSGTQLSVQLTVATQSDVDFYVLNTAASPQQRTFLGTANFPAGTSFKTVNLNNSVAIGDTIIATATDARSSSDGTSQFSQASTVATSLLVTNTLDDGPGSLRFAILAANADTAASVEIDFAIASPAPPGPYIITPASPLPAIARPQVNVNGLSQYLFLGQPAAAPIIQIDGNWLTADGLTLNTGSDGGVIRGLVIRNFKGAGIRILSNKDQVVGDELGTTLIGTDPGPGNQIGVAIDGSASGGASNTIGGAGAGDGNTIGFNTSAGISISGQSATGNNVSSNVIGVSGTSSQQGPGVVIETGSNSVGGNVIGFSKGAGIKLTGAGAQGNVVAGNSIGVNGTSDQANTIGVLLDSGAQANTIGGIVSSAANTIGFNTTGVSLSGLATAQNVVLGNFIGTDADGVNLGNTGAGVVLNEDTVNNPGNTVGGTTGGANIVGFNTTGIELTGNAHSDVVLGNYAGTDPIFRKLHNGVGILIDGNAHGNTVGAANDLNPDGTFQTFRGNIVGNNSSAGIQITDSANANQVVGNLVGTNGLANLGNPTGILVDSNATNNTIGGNGGLANDIGKNTIGIAILAQNGNSASSNSITGNFIGTNALGARLDNTTGVQVTSGSNTISGNTVGPNVTGILITGSTAQANQVTGNFIGTDTENASLGNQIGVEVGSSASANTIGGTTDQANTIAKNTTAGIQLDAGSSGNFVQGNWIGTDQAGDNLFNAAGILIQGPSNTVGGTASNVANTIAFNTTAGVSLHGAAASGNSILGNLIGTNSSGANQGNAIGVAVDGGSNNTIGGTAAGAGNTIAYSAQLGISILAGVGNAIRKNLYLGTNGPNSPVPVNDIAVNITGGANNGQQPPTLVSSTLTDPDSAGNRTLSVQLQVKTASAIDFYLQESTAPQQRLFLGTANVPPGTSSASITVKASQVGLSSVILATATDPTNGSSAFSSTTSTAGLFTVTNTLDSGVGSLRQAILNATTLPAKTPQKVDFQIPLSFQANSSGSTLFFDLTLAAPLVVDQKAVEIDGFTEADFLNAPFKPNTPFARVPYVVIDGTQIATASPPPADPASLILQVNAQGSTVRGLVFSGNTAANGEAILINGGGSNVIEGNFIGTDVTGTGLDWTVQGRKLVHSNTNGVVIRSSVKNTIGGAAGGVGAGPGSGNLISGNLQAGVAIVKGSSQNIVEGDLIGTDLTGSETVPADPTKPRQATGVLIDASDSNTIGGTAAGAVNVISGNSGSGVVIQNVSSSTRIENSLIGTDATGSRKLPNDGDGIQILNSTANSVGGPTLDARTIVSGNGRNGILIQGPSQASEPNFADANFVFNAFIGTSQSGSNTTVSLGNTVDGIRIQDATHTRLGFSINPVDQTAIGNLVVSGNDGSGVHVLGASTGTVIEQAYVGTDKTGSISNKFLGNVGFGIFLDNVTVPAGATPPATIIGGTVSGNTTSGVGNVISGNQAGGIQVLAGNVPTRIVANIIGTTADGTIGLGNGGDGIDLVNTSGNIVGGSGPQDGNLIAGNQRAGLKLSLGAGSNLVARNTIGTDAAGASGLGNGADGIVLDNVSGNAIGIAGAGNVVAGNKGDGIAIQNGATSNNLAANTIGGTSAGNSPGNLGSGIHIKGSAGNLIGGAPVLDTQSNTLTALGSAANVISGNSRDGILIDTLPAEAAAPNMIEGNLISLNSGNGVHVVGDLSSDVVQVQVFDNFIGTTLDGTTTYDAGGVPQGNALNGVIFEETAVSITGTTKASVGIVSGNVASGNGLSGVAVQSSGEGAVPYSKVLIAGNKIGTDKTGTYAVDSRPDTGSVLPLGNRQDGILLSNVSGVTAGGTASGGGHGGATTIGGQTFAGGNVISGNLGRGVEVRGDGLSGTPAQTNLIQGNIIGTDISGRYATGPVNTPGALQFNLGNLADGIFLFDYPGTVIQQNLVSNNRGSGIHARIEAGKGMGAPLAIILNTIGTSEDGTQAQDPNGQLLGNASDGVFLDSILGTLNNHDITSPGAIVQGNIVSGNRANGLDLLNSVAIVVRGNLIGTGRTGSEQDLGNASNGIFLNLSHDNLIDGTSAAGRNIISGNLASGVFISGKTGDDASFNVLIGNYIGLDWTGTTAVPNSVAGAVISGGKNNAIGYPLSLAGGTARLGAGNVISGNRLYGIELANGASGNLVQGNFIGTDSTGEGSSDPQGGPLGNTSDGVFLINVADNQIGGPTLAQGNVISGNSANGVRIFGLDSRGNTVENNLIGLGIDGQTQVFNVGNGVLVDNVGRPQQSGASNTIGPGNVISGNVQSGILILSTNTVTSVAGTGTYVLGNRIGTDSTGTVTVPNRGNGLFLFGSSGNVIGGDTGAGGPGTGPGNLISGNAQSGILIFSPNAKAKANNNQVLGNLIGTNLSGTSGIGNSADGVQILNSSFNSVGGDAGARNIISGNQADGVLIDALTNLSSTGNTIAGNYIGTDTSGTRPVGNGQNGVLVNNGAGNFIGMPGSATIPDTNVAFSASNVISANGAAGVQFAGTATGNALQGNYIGVAYSGAIAPNLGNPIGVYVNNTSGNVVGGTTPGAGNIIAQSNDARTAVGVQIQGPPGAASGTTVAGNIIGIDRNESAAGQSIGVLITNSGGNSIGGVAPVAGSLNPARNIISGNATAGVEISGVIPAGPGNQILGNAIGTNFAANGRPGSPDALGPRPGILTSQETGVLISGSSGNSVGGASFSDGSSNVISGNLFGIQILGNPGGQGQNAPRQGGNSILGNKIGTDSSGLKAVPNFQMGVFVTNSPSNVIAGNLISGNGIGGVELFNNASVNNRVAANLIGPDANGAPSFVGNAGTVSFVSPSGITVFFGLQEHGVVIVGASGNLIGSDGGNHLTGNIDTGVYIANRDFIGNIFATPTGNKVQNNTISTNGIYGVLLYNSPSNAVDTTGGTTNIFTGNPTNIRIFNGPIDQQTTLPPPPSKLLPPTSTPTPTPTKPGRPPKRVPRQRHPVPHKPVVTRRPRVPALFQPGTRPNPVTHKAAGPKKH